MSALGTYRAMMAAQWLAPASLRLLQERKLRRLVRHAYDTVPYYRRLMEDAGVTPADVRTLEDLEGIPVTTKSTLRDQPDDALISALADREKLHSEQSSGSSGAPFTVFYDRSFLGVRSGSFLRGLHAGGYRFGSRLLLVTGRRRASVTKRLLGWQYASIEESPRDLLERFQRFRPRFLYGCTTSLLLLAEQVVRTETAGWPLRAVITTAETLDREARDRLERVFHCRVFDFYGLTEMGLVGWECSSHRGYHLSEDTVLVEAARADGPETPTTLIMTNLDSLAMPFIRFDTGDTGTLAGNGSCACGRTLTMLARTEGRSADCVRLADGRVISPYAVTCRLERLPGIRRFQVIQNGLSSFTVRVVPRNGRHDAGWTEIRAAMHSILGDGVDIDIRTESCLEVKPGKKFRVVSSNLGGNE